MSLPSLRRFLVPKKQKLFGARFACIRNSKIENSLDVYGKKKGLVLLAKRSLATAEDSADIND